jgi:hypothetical protein
MNLKDRIIAGTITIGAIFTIFFAILAATMMSSCERVADRGRATNEWRGTVLKNNKLIIVENVDSLPVMLGDTVTVFYNEECHNYYIYNTTEEACDTATTERYIDGADTTYMQFEAWNVRLDKRVLR